MNDLELYALINRCFCYIDGSLVWKEKTSIKAAAIKIGSAAGWDNGSGYLVVKLMNKNYPIHRLVYLIHHGWLPITIDHIDGDTLNNKIENLRACSITENCQNQGISKNNTSGYKNVSKNQRCSTWKVEITVNGVKKYLGSYKDKIKAERVAVEARRMYFGEFARDL